MITHGNPNSKLFLLQRNAEFSPSSSRTSSPTSLDRVIPFGEYNLSIKKNSSPPKFTALEQPKILALGTLHSHFLTSDSVAVPSPTFVNAGWGTDSDWRWSISLFRTIDISAQYFIQLTYSYPHCVFKIFLSLSSLTSASFSLCSPHGLYDDCCLTFAVLFFSYT